MRHEEQFDLIIIGAGAAGLIAADFALSLGAAVALIESDRVGGDCTWTGCVPSKSLLKAASVAAAARQSARYGILTGEPRTDMAAVREYVRACIAHIYLPTAPEQLRQRGLSVFTGAARFLDAHTLTVGERQLRARRFLICTGAQPIRPALPGLEAVPYLTHREIFDNDRLPRHLLVVGGGPLGCEIAQAYRRLGAAVTLIAPSLLTRSEPQVCELLERVFAHEGIVRLPARAVGFSGRPGKLRVHTSSGTASGDMLLLAVGRAPHVQGLGLAAAGVHFGEQGITVDERLRTTARHIYAAGDVIGGAQYSHLAGWQGFRAVRQALLPHAPRFAARGRGRRAERARSRMAAAGLSALAGLPQVTFVQPEVAQIGLSERAARERFGAGVVAGELPLQRVDRAVSEDDTLGLVKLIAGADGRLLGASVVGQRAGEVIAELSLAMAQHLRLSDLAAAIHPYPTYNSAVQLLATQMSLKQFMGGWRGRVVRRLSRLWLRA
ncbi:MAG TPA: FAD-dependent oxidoreductase [Steroidobacteraceae bacterium]|nr:FAD-dependent oxidoreductase [Steroidobacteraceae bacterium]